MAFLKLYSTTSIPFGNATIDNSGYLIINDSTGMHAYQWTGSTLNLVAEYLVPGGSTIFYNGSYLFRIEGSYFKAYTFNGSLFAEVGSIARSVVGSANYFAVTNPGDRILFLSAVSGGGGPGTGTAYLLTFDGSSFTYRGSRSIDVRGNTPNLLPQPYAINAFYYGNLSYLYYQSVSDGPPPALGSNGSSYPSSNNGLRGGYGHLFISRYPGTGNLGLIDRSNGHKAPGTDYRSISSNQMWFDGTLLYATSPRYGPWTISLLDPSTDPFAIVSSAPYPEALGISRILGYNGVAFVMAGEVGGDTLSVWGSTTVNMLYVAQRTKRHVVKQLQSNVIPAIYTGIEFGLYGEAGSDNTMLKFPQGITVNSNNVYICDSLNSRIIKLVNSSLLYVSEYSTVTTIGRPYRIMIHDSGAGDCLYVVGVFNNDYTRIQKLDFNLVNIITSDNLHTIGGLKGQPIAICRGFDVNKILVVGAGLDVYETTESANFSMFINRSIIGELPQIYYGMVYHSNGYLYLNNGQRIIKVNSSYESVGASNKISKVVRWLKEDYNGDLLTYNVDRKKISKYDVNLNFVTDVYIDAGTSIDVDAYDISDIVTN